MATGILEVAFKAGRIAIYANRDGFDIKPEDYVVVKADKGVDLGRALQRGELHFEEALGEELKEVQRVATSEDLSRMEENRKLEDDAVRECKDRIFAHKLPMNLVDAEYQWDRKKLTFYFTADRRVDFRELVKDLAAKYRTRIELRQIGVRDAARHVGGFGACGCQLCCTTFIKKFENITTQYVKDQLITTGSSKLTGICGRLKCCLAFERDFYMETLASYPKVGNRVMTPDGKGIVRKIDIFNAALYVSLGEGDTRRFPVSEVSVKPAHKPKQQTKV